MCMEDTLFVHGGICGSFAGGITCCLGHVPGEAPPLAGKSVDVREWVDRLNAWGRREVEEVRGCMHLSQLVLPLSRC